MDKRNLAFGKTNFILLAIGVAVVILGFILMSGGGTTDPNVFNEEIFSLSRTRVAPIVCVLGFGLMIYAILHRAKKVVD